MVNVGPIGCSPSIRILVRNYECLEEISAVAKLHNKKLTEMVQKLENQLEGFKYSITDFYSALSQVLKYPSKYGIHSWKLIIYYVVSIYIIIIVFFLERVQRSK